LLCVTCHRFEAHPEGVHCEACAAGLRPAAAARTPGAWLRPPMALGRWTAALLGLVAVADLFAVWADFNLYDLVAEHRAAGESVIDVYTTHEADVLVALAAVLQGLAFVACATVFLVWFHRMRANAEVFDPMGHRMKQGWAIGGWFVPVANLWIPRRIAGDIWRASAPSGAPRAEVLPSLWWTMWLAGWALGRMASTLFDRAFAGDAAPVDTVSTAVAWMMTSDAFDAVTAAVAAWFVLRLSAAQHRKAVEQAAAAPAPAPDSAPPLVPPQQG
jgi:hypothetical protein